MTAPKQFLYPLTDGLEMGLTIGDDGLEGTKTTEIDLFEGYSPTIVSTVIESLTHFSYDVVGVLVQVWGNLHIVMVNEEIHKRLLLFVLDKGRINEAYPKEAFFPGNKWSRKNLYRVMGPGVKAIYHRCSYDDNWEKLENGPEKLRKYNEARGQNMDSNMAWNLFWGEGAV